MTDLSQKYFEDVGKKPMLGTVLIDSGVVHQLRKDGWKRICLKTQPDVADEDALIFEVGNDYIEADLPHLLAFLIETSRHDKRVTVEDFVKVVLDIFQKADWKPTGGNDVRGGGICSFTGKEDSLEIVTTDISVVVDQIRNGDGGWIEIPNDGTSKFVDLTPFSEVELCPYE